MLKKIKIYPITECCDNIIFIFRNSPSVTKAKECFTCGKVYYLGREITVSKLMQIKNNTKK